jgi:hypothetical protein
MQSYVFSQAFHVRDIEDAEYLPVFDILHGGAREIWEMELADCQGNGPDYVWVAP